MSRLQESRPSAYARNTAVQTKIPHNPPQRETILVADWQVEELTRDTVNAAIRI